jgi:hypothetical protein
MKKKLETKLSEIKSQMAKLEYESLYYLRNDWKLLREKELMLIELLENE